MTTDRGGAAAWPTHQLVLGEIVTRLLDASNPLPAEQAVQLLDLVPGRRPERAVHPVQRVQSPDVDYGVDCLLPTSGGKGDLSKVRTIGMVAAHAVLTGGHIVQGSAYARVLVGASTGRKRWSSYAARPGVVEVVQKVEPAKLPNAFLTSPPAQDLLDLGAVGHHLLERVQSQPVVDRGSRLKTQPARLRWALEVREDGTRPWVQLDLLDDGTYLICLKACPADVDGVIRYCEDVALHGWLLAALTGVLERSLRRGNQLEELAPALAYLGHLWNPCAHLLKSLHYLWDPIEDEAQLSREWSTQLARVRDGMSLLSLRALAGSDAQNGNW